MKVGKEVLLIIFFCYLYTSCSSLEPQAKNVNGFGKDIQEKQTSKSIISALRENNIKAYGEWDVDDRPLVYLVEKKDGDNRLLISDDGGEVLYDKTFVDIERTYSMNALRTINPQLIIEYNEGGNDSFVQMLDYERGKILERISEKDDNSFGAALIVQPQFRTGVNPAKEPFEIHLTPFGLPSSAGKFTRVFRYAGDKYHYVGEFERNKVGDFIVNNLVRK